jgi:carbamoyltransferase
MRVLGISPLDKDATASFLEDGQVVFACAEERLTRVKLQDGFPTRAVELGFQRTGWDPGSIDAVAYAFFDGETEASLIRQALAEDARVHQADCTADSLRRLRARRAEEYVLDRSVRIPGLPTERDEFMPPKPWAKRLAYDLVTRWPRLDWQAHRRGFRRWADAAIADHRLRTQQLHDGLARYGLYGKLRRFNHHDTHAANAFWASGFDQALLVTLDGYGSGNCGGIYVGGPDGIRPLHRFMFPNSLGQFYELVTSGLGFKPSRHEGKIVGLAAYGNPEVLGPILRDRFECRAGDLRIRASLNYYFTRALAQHFAKRDVAAAYQRVLEDVTRETVRYWLDKTGLRKVAVSGGVHANVKLNQRIRELDGVEEVFVYPNMGDGGCGTGAALLAFPKVLPGQPLENVYFGPDYSEAELAVALQRAELPCERCEDIEDRVAQLLTEDCIIGRFTGRMEYGPRALGNRSILYPARDPDVNQWLNQQLGRTEFMPFAPAALASEAGRLFKGVEAAAKTAEFMTITFDCTAQMARQCPAAVHVDNTARPQLVSERTNASFHRILRGYHERTGVPALINTSFNMHEEPIICSPDDAVRAFLLGRLDYLALGPFLVPHPRLQDIRHERQRAPVNGAAPRPRAVPAESVTK